MKLALVFDDLIQFGGAERLLLAATEIWPDAPVYTTVASKKWRILLKERGTHLKTSFLQKVPFSIRMNRFFAALHLHVVALEAFDFSDFDVVLSISARFSHGVMTRPETIHICYMNSPGRMFWEPHDYFRSEKFGRFLQKALGLPLSFLKMWDYSAAQRVDYFIANSKTPQKRIQKYYKRDSSVVYPFCEHLDNSPKIGDSLTEEDYFLVLSRLVGWKRVDLAVRACSSLGVNLYVVGEGSHRTELEKLADKHIKFLGYVPNSQKDQLLAGAQALINTQYEDFGIVPLEAMLHGTPVIAYKKGGAVETVTEGKTGMFFEEQSVTALKKTLEDFDKSKFDPEVLKKHAQRFSKEKFVKQLKETVNDVYLKNTSV